MRAQAYLVYSSSCLYHQCGGGGRGASLGVAALLTGAVAAGPTLPGYFPRPLAGALFIHLGWEQ